MKRIGYLYDKVISYDNCRQAILEASRHKTSRAEVREVLSHILSYTIELQQKLINHTFCTPYRSIVKYDRMRKKTRNIEIPAFFPDQCAHHAIARVINPTILKSSYLWSCANIPGRGLRHGCRHMEKILRTDVKHTKYCLKCDIKHFYESIDQDILIDTFNRKYKDKKLVSLLECLIRTVDKGIVIGNFTSPWFAELLLQRVDMFLLHNKNHASYYVRYADDIVLLSGNRRKLHKLCKSLICFLASVGLRLKENWQVFKVLGKDVKGRRIDFMGECFSHTSNTVRKRRSLSLIRTARFLNRNNYKVSMKHASSYISKSSCLLFTDSKMLKRTWYDTVDIDKLKNIIRKDSLCGKQHNVILDLNY